MATIKVKLRPSSVVGRAGTIFYQVTHRRATQQITTNIRLQPDEWDAIGEQVVVSVADKSIIQNRIDSDIALLKRIVKDLDSSGEITVDGVIFADLAGEEESGEWRN